MRRLQIVVLVACFLLLSAGSGLVLWQSASTPVEQPSQKAPILSSSATTEQKSEPSSPPSNPTEETEESAQHTQIGYLLSLSDGFLCVLDASDGRILYQTAYRADHLPPADQEALKEGVFAPDQKTLAALLEDYTG